MAQSKLDEVVSLAKRRGFVFPAGEIYGGTRSAWDYGPLGVALKDNIKREWWRSMVVTRPDVVGVDTSIILPPEVWVASGHVSVFNDPLVECLNCHKRNRADKLEATLYVKGHPGQTFAPPILFTQTPPFVEDLMLGIGTVDGVIAQGVHTVDSGSLDREAAMKVIAQHTRFGRGSSKIQ